MTAAREYGDARNRAAANGNDKQKGQVSAAYKIAAMIESLPRMND